MDSCWQNTPKEIVNYILKLACGRVIYRDNSYVEIGKIKETEFNKFDCINNFLHKKDSLKSEFQFVGNINRSWFLEFQFDDNLGKNEYVLNHGLSFDYLENNNFEICYWKYCAPVSNPSWTRTWTRIRTFI